MNIDPWMVEVTKEEIDNAMLLPGEYKEIDGKYYIKRGMLDGYIEPMPGEWSALPGCKSMTGISISLTYDNKEDFNFDNLSEHIEPEVTSD